MKLTFKVFGYEVATLDLELEAAQEHHSAAEKVVKATSRWWVGWMAR